MANLDALATCQCGQIAKFKFELRNFNFFDCKQCSLRFVSPRFLATDIYDNDYFQGASHGFGFTNYEDDKIASQGYLKKYLKWIKSFTSPSSNKLLDVGAANGYFVELANKDGFNACGIEISNSAVEWAKKLNRPVSQGTLETMKDDNCYDVITALDVLEHVPEPLNFLKIAHSKVARDGIILINVPYVGSFFSRISRKNWHAYLPPEHWMYFNKKSLKSMLRMAGFEVVTSRVISKSFTFGYVYMTIANSPQVPKFIRTIFNSLDKFVPMRRWKFKVYLPLFDNLTIIAKPIMENSAQEL